MVQVLPYVPSFGERLAPVLAQAGSDVFQGFQQRNANQRDQQVMNSFDPNDSPINQIQKFSQLSPQRQQTIAPLLQQLLKTQGAQEIQNQKTIAKEQKEQGVAQKEHEDISQTVNSLVDELETGKVGKFNQFNKLTAKGREHRAYFDELALGVEKRLATMVGKGVLSQARFAYLLKNLPKSSDTDATNRGRLKALAEEFKVIRKDEKLAEKASKPSLEDIFK